MKSLKVLCFQHVSFEGLGCIKDWCEANGHQITYTRFFENETIPQIENYDWLIIMGGPMGVYDENKYLWLSDEKTAIRNAILHNKTVIGICLGSQLIANVLGAKVYKNPVKEIGWFDISLTEQGIHESLFVNFDVTLKVFHWHGDTFDLPENAKHIAFSEICTNQAFLYKKNVLGLQFHLEVTEQSVAEMVENGNSELTDSKYIQCKSEILTGKNFIKPNNNKMFQLLNNFSYEIKS